MVGNCVFARDWSAHVACIYLLFSTVCGAGTPIFDAPIPAVAFGVQGYVFDGRIATNATRNCVPSHFVNLSCVAPI